MTSTLMASPRRPRERSLLTAGCLLVVAFIGVSLFVGVYDLDLTQVVTDPQARQVFLASRVPRTAALVLAGVAMSVAGLIMQLITQNKFVEPTTAGTVQFASLGILLVTILAPGAPVWARMIIASGAAFVGTMVFLGFLRRVTLRSAVIVPLVGIMLGAVVGAVTTYLALQFRLSQMLSSWQAGSFSDILRGRYEVLWIVGVLTVVAYLAADRFSVAGLGEDTATNVGVNYRRVVMLGTSIVALISGVVVTVVGSLPFLGLIVPNLVSLTLGDNARRGLPWVCLTGAGIVVACDILSRTLRPPAEIPVGTILGVIGAAVFIILILRQDRHAR
jgi:iron complex transport system permease protein